MDYQGFRCYTDGSKTSHGVGSGTYAMIHTHILKTRCFGLEKHATVFQAELHAIKQATRVIEASIPDKDTDREFGKIRILSDSQAALMSLDRIDTDSQLVKEVKEALNLLGNTLSVELA